MTTDTTFAGEIADLLRWLIAVPFLLLGNLCFTIVAWILGDDGLGDQ